MSALLLEVYSSALLTLLSYAALNGVCPSPEQLYNETFHAAIKSGYLQTINSKDYINDSLFIKNDNITFSPEKESTFVGAAHNRILDNLTTRTRFLPSEYDLSSYDKYVKAVLTDSTFKSTFIDGIRNVFGDLDKFSTPDQTKRDDIVSQIIDSYLKVHIDFVYTLGDAQNIVKDYIEIINDCAEMSDIEKLQAFSGLETAIYSTRFWTDDKTDNEEVIRK